MAAPRFVLCAAAPIGMPPVNADRIFDVAVVGAGAVGAAAALALARDGVSPCLIGRSDMRPDGRTVALLHGSIRLLEALGVWPALRPQAAPLVTMRIIDDSGSLFRPPPVAFQASEIGLEAFGWNIENTALVAGLIEAARAEPHLQLTSEDAGKTTLGEDVATIALSGGSAVAARLVVAADGRNSRLREAAGIATRSWSYPQSALATHLSHERDHRDASTEFHTRSGPFTLVPMAGRRSSLVWVTNRHHAERLPKPNDPRRAGAIGRQAQSILGKMRVAGPRGLIPMSGLSVERYVADRLALVGEAAHVFPPI